VPRIAGMTDSYIQRTLVANEKLVSEIDCFVSKGIYIVLAEPGAGKSDLLESLAKRNATKFWSASVFRHTTQLDQPKVLIVDALDEVARTGESAINGLLVKAIEQKAEILVFSSRADVWNAECERFVRAAAGSDPFVLKLEPFSKSEQHALFQNLFPAESFEQFLEASSALGLEPLFGNPMFLRLFAEGFIQMGHKFTSKAAAFRGAVERLAFDDGKNQPSDPKLPLQEVQSAASEIFAKLLLSGSSGVSTVEQLSDDQFPYALTLSERHSHAKAVLNTRLFKPGRQQDLHEPIHRIVAEFCAAGYLVDRISRLSDRLSLSRCMALIAPNGAVRDDLRGLLGWMSALGNQAVQSAAIALDAYAVVANGDASQLTTKSKNELLNGLRKQAEQDPYFRRSDSWRNFSLSGFFSDALAPSVATILQNKHDETHLRRLILEMMQDCALPSTLAIVFQDIAVDKTEDYILRILAAQSLVSQPEYQKDGLIKNLFQNPEPDCLKVAAEIVLQINAPETDRALVLDLLRHAGRADIRKAERKANVSDRLYVIGDVIRTRKIADVIWLLDNLCAELSCTCAKVKPLECDCRKDASKVIGRLLDRYFELQSQPYDKSLIWKWIKNLRFGHDIRGGQSIATKILRECHALRQEIQKMAFSGISKREEIWEVQRLMRWGEMHSGISFSEADQIALSDSAFAENNVELWLEFCRGHDIYENRDTPILMRTQMRKHANEKTEFMRLWANHNRSRRKRDRDNGFRFSRNRKWKDKTQAIITSNLEFLKENRSAIEAGSQWWWTQNFAQYFMHFPDDLHQLTDNLETVRKTLYNCLNLLNAHVPSLQDLANGNRRNIAEVLHAACLVHFRAKGNLEHVELSVLRAAKTELGSAKAYGDGEAERLEAEVNRLLFLNDADRELYAVEYFESLLESDSHRLWSLKNNHAFESVKVCLAWKWLQKYPNALIENLDTLFSICAEAGMAKELAKLISVRCAGLFAIDFVNVDDKLKKQLEFWRLRHFFFCDTEELGLWASLLADKNVVLELQYKTGRWDRDSSKGWPSLSADKVFLIIDAFIEEWPRVHLPSSWGTSSPVAETAYRFLQDVLWQIETDTPDARLSIIRRMLNDQRFQNFRNELLSMQAKAVRHKSLQDFIVPSPSNIVSFLDGERVASVEDLRALLLEELQELQLWIYGGETSPISLFWPHGKRVDENTARDRIVERLQTRFSALDALVVVEHHMEGGNRCDITLNKSLGGLRKLLVCEVKGQWHEELFIAAKQQLHERYALHPDASEQGVYLVLWFGEKENVAGRVNKKFKSAVELRSALIESLPIDIASSTSVFVLDVSKRTA
jgi:hypothetical protein